MGPCILLLICLLQAEFGKVWAQEQTGVLHVPQEPRRDHKSLPEMPGGSIAIDTLPDNLTHILEDSHRYYSWHSFGSAEERTQQLWVDLSDPRLSQVRMHGILSNTHRQAARVALSFDFPFYGHSLRQITIATGGFIFMGEIVHRMLTATQYIAPLMANFDPSFSKDSTVQYMDDGEMFVVQWDRVRLQGREEEGAFTFQAVLHRAGTIVFSYRDVPLLLEEISSTQHPVKVGLSDAFMVLLPSHQTPGVQRRTIYEYHRVEIDTTKITNHSAFEFTPLPNCLQHESCEVCVTSNQTGCGWCNILQRCSDGMDRHRQDWLDHGCSEEAKDNTCEDYALGGEDSTTAPSSSEPTLSAGVLLDIPVTEDDTKLLIHYNGNGPPRQQGASVNTGIIAGVVAAVLLLLALTLLALYINSHPAAAPPLYLLPRRAKHWPSMKFQNQNCHSSYTEMEVGGCEKEGFIEAEQY